MKKKTILATAVLSLSAVFAVSAVKLNDAPPHHPVTTAFGSCVQSAVLQEYPEAKGGLVLAKDRAPGYQDLGDMLHYRERGFNTVNSVSVDKSDDGILVFAGTRKGPVILPSSIFPGISTEIEHGYFSDGETGRPAVANGATSEEKQISARQVRVINKILQCGVWK